MSSFESIIAQFKSNLESAIAKYGELEEFPPISLLKTYFYLVGISQTAGVVGGSSSESTETNPQSITITSTSANYARGVSIDLRDHKHFSVVPSITVAGGAVGYYKVQWSLDNLDWFDETLDAPRAVSSGEQVVTQSTMVRSFPSDTSGLKPLSAATFDKRARYVAIAQRSDSNVSYTCEYSYQKF